MDHRGTRPSANDNQNNMKLKPTRPGKTEIVGTNTQKPKVPRPPEAGGKSARVQQSRRKGSPVTPLYSTARKTTRPQPERHPSSHASVVSADQSPPIKTVETTENTAEDDPLLWKSPPLNPEQHVLETNYYQNPTLLGRLILNQKYGSALQRLYSTPRETRIWLCSKRSENRYSIRQLPIHIACGNVVCTHDSRAKRQLNELIATLVYMYSDGAHLPDHRGRLPLHEALWYGAEPETLAIFFMSKPEALLMKDHKGRSLRDLNRHRSGVRKEEVQKLLSQGLNFWRTARDEAFVRLKHGTVRYPSNAGSVSSSSVLASSFADDESIRKEHIITEAPNLEQITAIAWDQLEKRSLIAEKILAETIERNYELSRRVEALSSLEEAQSNDLLQEITRIGRENTTLNKKIHDLERIIKQKIISGDDEVAQQQRLALAEVSSLIGLSEVTSLSDNEDALRLPTEMKRMSSKVARQQDEQRKHIRKIKFVVESMMTAGSDANTSISGLTSRSHDESELDGSLGGKTMIVDRIPEQRDIVDNLELIFRYAAAYDYARRFPSAPDAENENLSAMLDATKSLSRSSSRSVPEPQPRLGRWGTTRQEEISLPALLPPDEIDCPEQQQEEGIDPIPDDDGSI